MIEKLIELNNWFLAKEMIQEANPETIDWSDIIQTSILLGVPMFFVIKNIKSIIKYIKENPVQSFFIAIKIAIQGVAYYCAMFVIVWGSVEIVSLYFPKISKTLKEVIIVYGLCAIILTLLLQFLDRNTRDGHYIKMSAGTNIERILKMIFVLHGVLVPVLLYMILFVGIPLVLSIATVHAPIGNSKVKEIMSTFVEYLGIIILPVSLFLWARWESKKREDIQESEKEYRNLDIFVTEKIIPLLDKLEDENDYSIKYKTLHFIWLELTTYKPTSKISKKIKIYHTVIQDVLTSYKNPNINFSDSMLDHIIEDTRNIADITETNNSLLLYLGIIEKYIKEEKQLQLEEQTKKQALEQLDKVQ